MKKFFQKQREIITIFIYGCFIVVLIYFVVLPLIVRVNDTRDQIQEEHIKQDIKKQQISELPKMEEQYNMLQNNEKSVDVLLDKNDAVGLIERLEKTEILIERAMDEIFQNKERIKLLQEDRKRDIEDTADFIK